MKQTPRTYTAADYQAGKQIRQGDVLLIPITAARADELKKGLEPLTPPYRRAVLAHGEATGHSHALPITQVTGYHRPLTPEERETGKEPEVSLIEIAEALAELSHNTHDKVSIEGLAGAAFEIRIQRQYTPKEIQRVAD